MKNQALIGEIVVAGQPSDDEIAGLRADGFDVVVNLREPGELALPEGPKVEAAGLSYFAVPFTAATLTADHIRRVREAVESAKGRVLVHCHAGTRAAVAAALAEADRQGLEAEGALVALAEAGFDVLDTPYERFIRNYF